MKKPNAILLVLAAFILGIVTGLFIAAYKGPPPGLERGAMNRIPEIRPDSGIHAKLEAVQEKIKASPKSIPLYVEAGNLLMDHEQYDQALAYYQQALEIGGPQPDLLTDMGVCYRRMGNPGKAVEAFRQARKLDPRHENSALNLGIVLFHDLGQKEEALAAWREYLELNPGGKGPT